MPPNGLAEERWRGVEARAAACDGFDGGVGDVDTVCVEALEEGALARDGGDTGAGERAATGEVEPAEDGRQSGERGVRHAHDAAQ